MPNHVTTRCTVYGPLDTVTKFRETCFSNEVDDDGDEYDVFDFNTVIPMPESLRDSEEGSNATFAKKLVEVRADFFAKHDAVLSEFDVKCIREHTGMMVEPIRDVVKVYLMQCPEIEALGLKRMKAIAETGYGSWYNWSLDNWGTKWNSYDVEISDDYQFVFTFCTAWSFPEPIFERLAEMFPDLSFYCVTFDEGFNFAGFGYYNPPEDEVAFHLCDATNDMYEEVYGYPPDFETE